VIQWREQLTRDVRDIVRRACDTDKQQFLINNKFRKPTGQTTATATATATATTSALTDAKTKVRAVSCWAGLCCAVLGAVLCCGLGWVGLGVL
jgi:hypothetical protein